jgi:hypothetical protein
MEDGSSPVMSSRPAPLRSRRRLSRRKAVKRGRSFLPKRKRKGRQ